MAAEREKERDEATKEVKRQKTIGGSETNRDRTQLCILLKLGHAYTVFWIISCANADACMYIE